MRKVIIYYIFGISSLLFCLSALTIYSFIQYYWITLFIRVLFLLIILVLLFKVFHKGVILNTKINAKKSNLFLSIFSIFIVIIFLELIFTFIPRSHGVGFAYAGKNWRYYYRNLNQEGFRDHVHSKKENNKKKLIFIGDSYTEGQGIINPKFRFSNIIEQELGECFDVYNFGISGMNSIEQLELLGQLDFQPDLMVFQYYGNDIEGDANSKGHFRKPITAYEDLNLTSEVFVRSSYLFNYIYWSHPRKYLSGYLEYLESCYDSDSIFNEHKNTLEKIKKTASNYNIQSICIIIPYLQDIRRSDSLYVNKISTILKSGEYNFKIIPIAHKIKNIETSRRIINSNDPHASKVINQLIADELISEIDKFCQ